MRNEGSIVKALVGWPIVGSALQVAMVVVGHYLPAIAELFPIVGTSISLISGALFGILGATSWGKSAWGGGLVGAVCPIIGVGISVALGDVGPEVFGIATGTGIVVGAIGGIAGFGIFGRR